MSQFSHVLDAAGVGTVGQILFALAAALGLSALVGVLAEPGLGGGRKLLWSVLALVPFLGGALWFAVGRSRAEPESVESESVESGSVESGSGESDSAESDSAEPKSPEPEPAERESRSAISP